MKQSIFVILMCLLTVNTAQSQNIKAFYIGHSLSDQIPDMVASLSANHAELSFNNWVYQSIPGSPLRWNWQAKDRNDYWPNPPHIYGFYHPINGLQAGNFDVLVLTESVPRHWGPWGIEETYQYADSFFVYANLYNPNIQVYLYEVWHCILSGTPTGCMYDINTNPWRQRLDDDLPMWESAVNVLNERFNPANPICLIPGGQGLARLHDAIIAGTVPGVTSIEQLFSDDIHLTDVGKYFIACIHFGMLHRTSPVGLTHQLHNMWGVPFTAPSPALALRLQELAWETVTAYPASCVTACSFTPAISGSSTSCQNGTYTYNVAPIEGSTYSWTVTGGIIVNGQGTASIQVQWSNNTIGNVSIEQTLP